MWKDHRRMILLSVLGIEKLNLILVIHLPGLQDNQKKTWKLE